MTLPRAVVRAEVEALIYWLWEKKPSVIILIIMRCGNSSVPAHDFAEGQLEYQGTRSSRHCHLMYELASRWILLVLSGRNGNGSFTHALSPGWDCCLPSNHRPDVFCRGFSFVSDESPGLFVNEPDGG
jgi:hypothetical protein